MHKIFASARFPGIDMAKILAIYLVVLYHISGGYGPTLVTPTPLTAWSCSFVNALACPCVDLFALITGFLCVNSECKYSRLLSLWITAVFWGGGCDFV